MKIAAGSLAEATHPFSVTSGLMGILIGGIFLAIGLLITTGYRGIARRLISLPSDGKRESTRYWRTPKRNVPIDERILLDIGRRYYPDLIIGVAFTLMGGLAFILSLIGLAVILIR